MKTCPICKTTLFEDMDVCYGCMYRFGSNPELEKISCSADLLLAAEPERPAAGGDDMRAWTVRLEVRNRLEPGQTWAVELAPPPYEPTPEEGGARAALPRRGEEAQLEAEAASRA